VPEPEYPSFTPLVQSPQALIMIIVMILIIVIVTVMVIVVTIHMNILIMITVITIITGVAKKAERGAAAQKAMFIWAIYYTISHCNI